MLKLPSLTAIDNIKYLIKYLFTNPYKNLFFNFSQQWLTAQREMWTTTSTKWVTTIQKQLKTFRQIVGRSFIKM